jgi:hypothetical protein
MHLLSITAGWIVAVTFVTMAIGVKCADRVLAVPSADQWTRRP